MTPRPTPRLLTAACLLALASACSSGGDAAIASSAPDSLPTATTANAAPDADAPATPAPTAKPFEAQAVATFDEPWAMAFLPDGRALVTEKGGTLKLVDVATGNAGSISGGLTVDYGGQGGLGDVAVHPDFANNGFIYLSYVEAGDDDTRGAAVARAKLVPGAGNGGALQDLTVIWRQSPKVEGRGHFSHRLLFGPDGKLWVSSGERQKFDPAQDMQANLGKVLRLNDDGSVPADNPFADRGGVTAQIWSLGHRNILGIAFDAQGNLWENEMGPKGGDELNRIERGKNYGYPIVSNGRHYDGRDIPDHVTRPEFVAPKTWWDPVISPSSLVIYSGDRFPDWRGDALIGGLSSKALIRVAIDGDASAREVARYDMDERIRGVVQGPDGGVWLLEDGDKGRLLRLDPAV